MLVLMKSVSVVVMSLVALVATGCASGKGGGGGSGAVASGGVMCPKCETVWVSEVVDQGTKIQRLAYDRKMICPDCDAMAQSHLTGEGNATLHECPTCKVTPRRLSPARITPSHPKGTHG